MTLKQWEKKTGQLAQEHTSGSLYFLGLHGPFGVGNKNMWELYHLDDYAVSTVGAGTIWLSPRRIKT